MEIILLCRKKAYCIKMAVKTCFHGNVNIDEHVITTTLKYSQILRRNHQDLVVIHVALMVLK